MILILMMILMKIMMIQKKEKIPISQIRWSNLEVEECEKTQYRVTPSLAWE